MSPVDITIQAQAGAARTNHEVDSWHHSVCLPVGTYGTVKACSQEISKRSAQAHLVQRLSLVGTTRTQTYRTWEVAFLYGMGPFDGFGGYQVFFLNQLRKSLKKECGSERLWMVNIVR